MALLDEYMKYLKEVMDLGIVVELNILKTSLRYREIRANIKEKIAVDNVTDLLALGFSPKRSYIYRFLFSLREKIF